MKVAVILTGALRTIKKTIKYFKKNILLNHNIDVFACLQNDTTEPNMEWATWFKNQIGNHLKSIIWFSPSEHHQWIHFRDNLLGHIHLQDSWKDYLKTSGSMIEHYQMYLSYLEMCQFEALNGHYSNIIRCRTDTIFGKPLDFHWLNWTDTEVENRMTKINLQLHQLGKTITPQLTLHYFMNTIISDSLIENIANIGSEYLPAKHISVPISPSQLNNYIKNGEYILTLRANLLYIVNRDSFQLIPGLPFLHLFVHSPHNTDYWFNSEEQFQAICYLSNLTVFNYSTQYEAQSLYEYNEKQYFDENYNLISPHLLYCLVRN